jgi:hypothetical protein
MQSGLTSARDDEGDGMIDRCLRGDELERLRKDLAFLVTKVRDSRGELFLALRRNYSACVGYVSVYSRGNSLARVTLNKSGTYTVDVAKEFFGDSDDDRERRLRRFVPDACRRTKRLRSWTVDAKQLHSLLQSANVNTLIAGVKRRNHQEELSFEQALIADNLGREDLIFVDRQVDEPDSKDGELDLLALQRVRGDQYRLLPMEVKLGNNPELSGDVGDQLERYVRRIETRFEAYKQCYEAVYEQLRSLGLIEAGPNRVEIVPGVTGVVVVGGYNGIAEKSLKQLHKKHPGVRVSQVRNHIDV